jgi:hypothetical protein
MKRKKNYTKEREREREREISSHIKNMLQKGHVPWGQATKS